MGRLDAEGEKSERLAVKTDRPQRDAYLTLVSAKLSCRVSVWELCG